MSWKTRTRGGYLPCFTASYERGDISDGGVTLTNKLERERIYKGGENSLALGPVNNIVVSRASRMFTEEHNTVSGKDYIEMNHDTLKISVQTDTTNFMFTFVKSCPVLIAFRQQSDILPA